jgi:NitT/TauT family transport system ATP-binding protein
LDNINFEVQPNESLCILGPSGCGKTTLLRIIDCLIARDQGDVLIDGVPVTQPRPDVAMVFQHFGLFPWKRLEENIAYGLELRGRPRQETTATIERYIELMSLKGFEKSYPHQPPAACSSAGLARALAINPSLLLMDEPFGSLDAQTREMMQEELLRIWRARKTMIFVTHSIDEAIFGGPDCDHVRRQARSGDFAGQHSRPRKLFRSGPPHYIKLKIPSEMLKQSSTPSILKRIIHESTPPSASSQSSYCSSPGEYFGRRANPILFTYPTAIIRAFIGLVASGELQAT